MRVATPSEQSSTTPDSVGGMGNAEALTTLQDRFCISRIGGDIRVLDRGQIEAVQSGTNTADVHYYTKPHGELLMRRYLESLDIPHKPKEVIADFWISEFTLMYDAVAFSPCATPCTTLNY